VHREQATRSRRVLVTKPSFPEVTPDVLLPAAPDQVWQVMCGDADHWRVGLYSPVLAHREQVEELEQHDCPELFMLMSGRLTLVLAEGRGGLRELPLEFGRPVLVSAPHTGYCPDGPHSGQAIVVERDVFSTEYRPVADY
jgi:hypothetical protein